MIYNGRTGYVRGDLAQSANTVLAMTKGPILGRNWHTTAADPSLPIYQIAFGFGSATAVVKLQGTNTIAFDGQNLTEMDFSPTEGAVWTDIVVATAPTGVSGTFSVGYEYLRLIITTPGTGYVLNAGVRWN